MYSLDTNVPSYYYKRKEFKSLIMINSSVIVYVSLGLILIDILFTRVHWFVYDSIYIYMSHRQLGLVAIHTI